MSELVPGTLEMLILRTLVGAPMHDYGIAQLGVEIGEFRRVTQAIERVLTPEG